MSKARCVLDIETVSDCHVGMGHEQLKIYALGAGLTEFMVIHGGDLLHDCELHPDQHFTGEKATRK